MGRTAEQSFLSRQGQDKVDGVYTCSGACHPFSGYRAIFLWRDSHRPSNGEVKNGWKYTSTSLYVFTAYAGKFLPYFTCKTKVIPLQARCGPEGG